MSEFNGVEVFEILTDGCLNGVWSDNNPAYKNKIFGEIAIKIPGTNPDKLIGKYVSSYLEYNNEIITCNLEIKEGVNAQYEFIWSNCAIPATGFGWRIKENQIMVSYTYNC